MRKPRPNIGSFFRIPLEDDSFGYGRILDYTYVAFYDHHTPKPSEDLDTIAARPVLFALSVRVSTLSEWTVIGKRPLEAAVLRPFAFFTQDIADFRQCRLYDTSGMSRDASPEECVGVEASCAWDASHVVERLGDVFHGRTNEMEERMRVRLR